MDNLIEFVESRVKERSKVLHVVFRYPNLRQAHSWSWDVVKSGSVLDLKNTVTIWSGTLVSCDVDLDELKAVGVEEFGVRVQFFGDKEKTEVLAQRVETYCLSELANQVCD